MARRRVRVALVEVPAVDVQVRGESWLDDFTLNHPKYPQLVLAANASRTPDVEVDVDIVDLKAGSEVERLRYGGFDYCSEPVDLWRVGVPFEAAAERLFAADVVGLSADFTMERSVVVQTIDFLRSRRHKPLVVVGGHDATADPYFYLRRGADLCVLGEGETAIQEIASALAAGENPRIRGATTLDGDTVQRPARRMSHRFDEIEFPGACLMEAARFDESPDGPLPPYVAPPIMSLETSRGCPEACSFCDVTYVVGRYRSISFDLLEQQVLTLKRAGIRTIQVLDDNLLYRTLPQFEGERGRQTVLDLFNLLYDEGFAWEFFNGLQLGLLERDGVVDGELIAALYRHRHDHAGFAGCFRSYVPIDKVTSEEMSLLRKLKPIPVTQSVVAAIAEQAPPALALGFVIGSIRETPRSLDETAARAEEFRDLVRVSSSGRTECVVLPLCSVPLPGTPDFRSFRESMMFDAERHPELYNIFMSVLHTSHFTPLEMTRRRQLMRDGLNAFAAPVPPG